MRPTPMEDVLKKAAAAMGVPNSQLTNRHVIAFAPPMSEGFWGEISFFYQGGKCVTAEVRETIKP